MPPSAIAAAFAFVLALAGRADASDPILGLTYLESEARFPSPPPYVTRLCGDGVERRGRVFAHVRDGGREIFVIAGQVAQWDDRAGTEVRKGGRVVYDDGFGAVLSIDVAGSTCKVVGTPDVVFYGDTALPPKVVAALADDAAKGYAVRFGPTVLRRKIKALGTAFGEAPPSVQRAFRQYAAPARTP